MDLVNFPYAGVLGVATSQQEDISILDVNLAQRTVTTVASSTLAGVSVIPVTALSVGSPTTASTFPDAKWYRVRIGRGTVNDEIVLVEGAKPGPNRLILSYPAAHPHASTEKVELVSDTLSVDTLSNLHEGYVSLSDRTTLFPQITSTARDSAEALGIYTSAIPLSSATGFPGAGYALINFANAVKDTTDPLVSPLIVGATLLNVTNVSKFNNLTPFAVVIGVGTPFEENVIVTNVNVGLSQLTINSGTFGTRYAHAAGTRVRVIHGDQEKIEYSSIVGNNLQLAKPIVLQYNHQASEMVLPSTGESDPRTTGYDFPFRMPPDIFERLKYVLDLVRAAGVKVSIIRKR
jgi:hypothetical protein